MEKDPDPGMVPGVIHVSVPVESLRDFAPVLDPRLGVEAYAAGIGHRFGSVRRLVATEP